MAAAIDPVRPARLLHPVHAILLAGMLPLFLGAMLSDWAYSSTFEIQWSNFASWLIVGAMVLLGLTILWAAIDFFRADVGRSRPRALYLLALIATFVLGLINAFVHSKDAWAIMPAAMILSVLVFLLALVSVWLGFSSFRSEVAR